MATRAKKVKKTKRVKKAKPATLPGTDIKILPALVPLLVPIDDVKPDPKNPRITKDLGSLRASIRRYGVRKPIVVNERDGFIEAGHQTLAALKELGAKHIPVAWADDDRLEAKGYNAADNRTSEVVAEWDRDALSELLRELKEEDEDMIMGWEGDALDDILKDDSDGDTSERGIVNPVSLKDMDCRPVTRVWILLGVRQDKYQEVHKVIDELRARDDVVSSLTAESQMKNVKAN